jgi:dimethylamine/trimethylamine dehydrogenase
LPGLSAWGRVKDYRNYQISQMPNVETYLESKLTADQVLDFGFEHVCIATGSTWRSDGVARVHIQPIPIDPAMPIFTPDDLMAGGVPKGRVVIYDDDHFYMGGVLAELLAGQGAEVTLITPAALVSEWTVNTLEQATIHQRLAAMGIEIVLNRVVEAVLPKEVRTTCSYSGDRDDRPADAVVLVTAQIQNDAVWQDLKARRSDWADHGIQSIRAIGDAEAPGPIAWATYAGHRYARELDEPSSPEALPFRREVTALQDM